MLGCVYSWAELPLSWSSVSLVRDVGEEVQTEPAAAAAAVMAEAHLEEPIVTTVMPMMTAREQVAEPSLPEGPRLLEYKLISHLSLSA